MWSKLVALFVVCSIDGQTTIEWFMPLWLARVISKMLIVSSVNGTSYIALTILNWTRQYLFWRKVNTLLCLTFLAFCFTVNDIFFLTSINYQLYSKKNQQVIYNLLLDRSKYIISLYECSCFVPQLNVSIPTIPGPLVHVYTYSCRHPSDAHSLVFCSALCPFLPCSVLIHSLCMAMRTNRKSERKGQLCWIHSS